uniref:Uncharacterized protein n=1 Tax=Petromyzon marinus TaxID=7757 RepID=S4RWC8_PETMA
TEARGETRAHARRCHARSGSHPDTNKQSDARIATRRYAHRQRTETRRAVTRTDGRAWRFGGWRGSAPGGTCVGRTRSLPSSCRGPRRRRCPASGWRRACARGCAARRARSPCRSCGPPRPAPRRCSGSAPGSGSPARRSDGPESRSRSDGGAKVTAQPIRRR